MIFIFFLFWASSSEDALFHYGKKDRASLLPGESEIRPCVFIADGTHDLTERFHVSGIHAFLHPLSNQAAEDPAKILVPRIAQEAPAVGEHPHKARKIAESRKGSKLCDYAVEVVIEPPGTAMLNIAHGFLILETSRDRVYGSRPD